MKIPLASLCALCLLSVASPLNALSARAAQPAPTPVPAVLSLSHATGALSFALPGQPARRVEPGDTLAVPAGVPVVVQVTDTNTALSQYSLMAEKGDAPQLVPLNRFLSPALREIDDAIFGPAGLHRTYLAIFRTGLVEILNLQPVGSKAKAYQVKQVRNVILKYKLGGTQ